MNKNDELYEKCGVYKIVNRFDSKVYYGSTVDSFMKRWNNHKSQLNRNAHDNEHLQNAWNLYGGDNFDFDVIYACPPNECLLWEQLLLDMWWDRCDNCYNISPTAKNCYGVKHTEETKKKQSESKKGKPPGNKGKPRSQRAKDKTKKTMEGRPNPMLDKTHTDEVRDKMSIIAKQRVETKETIEKRLFGIKKWWAGRSNSKVLDLEKAAQIMKLITEDVTLRNIATKFNISNGTVVNIRIGRAWKKAIALLEPDVKEMFLNIQKQAIERRNKERS
jgi:group I intron endonuclease